MSRCGQLAHSRTLASTADVWGADAWRYDKDAFKKWVAASAVEGSIESKQMYAHFAMCFGDCDVDKTGFINASQFDRLLEITAALPRRFGLAPSWRVEYGTIENRHRARKAMFDAIDGTDGTPKGKIAMYQFIRWARQHIAAKAPQIGDMQGDVALRHVEDYTVEEYVAWLDQAVNNPDSGASANLYNYLLTSFVEADEGGKGRISLEEFDRLIDIAAKTPRFFKLAPDTSDPATRKAMFDAMDTNKTGFVTFRKFLEFVRGHVKERLAAHAAK